MTVYNFGGLGNAQHLAFDSETDVLNFGATGTGGALRLVQGVNLKLTLGSKSVYLDGTALGQLAIDSISFGNGSLLVAGDGTSSILRDWYGQFYDASAQTTGSSYWGLGGADVVEAGSGADYIVGNTAYTVMNHVARAGSTGAPTATAYASISADGRFVAFEGAWTSFGSVNDTHNDVVIKDMNAGSFSNENKDANGVVGLSSASAPLISADGQWVTFVSYSTLVPNATGGTCYIASATGNEITAVSTTALGAFADRAADNPDISADGKFVVFESWAGNLNGNGNTNYTDVYLKNIDTGALTRLSTSTGGTDGNGESLNPHISADGRLVVFQSDANNLSAGDTNGYGDIFVFDASDGSLTNLTAALPGTNLSNTCTNPDIAWDDGWGGVVVFQTARSLVDADQSNGTDIYALNLADNSLQLVSADANGNGLGGSHDDAAISGDGRFVVFRSYFDELPGDTNGTSDIYVKDLVTGAIALVSRAPNGAGGDAASSNPEISLGGDWIVFESSATNFATTDGDAISDVFRVSNPLLVDVLRGGAGNDTYVLARATDRIEELTGGGTDTVQSSIGWTLGAYLENLTLTGTANLAGRGNGLNNLITGNAGNNVLTGGAGVDTVSYAAATAAVTVSLAVTTSQATVGAGSDLLTSFENLIGSSGADKLTGDANGNRVEGGGGADTIVGGTGNDTLLGGLGNDSLRGGAGADRLGGDAGADVFRFDSTTGSDTVVDFLSGTDDLQFAFGIGDGDAVVDGGVVRAAPGGFGAGAELVIFTANIAGISSASAAAAIGSASTPYSIGAHRLFAVDTGTSSAVFLFTAADANAAVSAGELTLLATLDGAASTALGDYLFGV